MQYFTKKILKIASIFTVILLALIVFSSPSLAKCAAKKSTTDSCYVSDGQYITLGISKMSADFSIDNESAVSHKPYTSGVNVPFKFGEYFHDNNQIRDFDTRMYFFYTPIAFKVDNNPGGKGFANGALMGYGVDYIILEDGYFNPFVGGIIAYGFVNDPNDRHTGLALGVRGGIQYILTKSISIDLGFERYLSFIDSDGGNFTYGYDNISSYFLDFNYFF